MSAMRQSNKGQDVICLSHLRWDFVFQRPQQLLTRCAARRRVFFLEEPVIEDGAPRLVVRESGYDGVHVAVPHLPAGLSEAESHGIQASLASEMLADHSIRDYVLWYYTPMAVPFTRQLAPAAVVYDCMDELSAFAGAPPALRRREAELLRRADLVLTGGQSLYEAKRGLHPNIHPFPSSVDVAHFARARAATSDPEDQAHVARPRIGFFGVIDERLDLELLAAVAALRPDWQLVMIGPVVKIDPASLPRGPNVHWLGPKKYAELPGYLAGWDVATLPFARNESTRFISPTKTPEYLAAGCPVVSTSIRDVVRPYGELGLARIADTPADFVAAIEACLAEPRAARTAAADTFLATNSWDRTWARIEALLERAIVERRAPAGSLDHV